LVGLNVCPSLLAPDAGPDGGLMGTFGEFYRQSWKDIRPSRRAPPIRMFGGSGLRVID
jgi:hypothetical protein